ncbi:MAG: hypothetical protein EHM34_10310 [Nitrosopumilales archaeon]|nr:MAG: hypothetical protein EHM34_10310 [Nitrosopumilales archaeon]
MKNNEQSSVTMFQIVANHQEKSVQITQVASKQDLYLMWGVAFENDPDLYETMNKIISTYQDFKNEQFVNQ